MVQAIKSIVMPEHVAKVSINFKIRMVSTKMKTPASLYMLQSDQSCITIFQTPILSTQSGKALCLLAAQATLIF